MQMVNHNHASGGAPPSRRLTAWPKAGCQSTPKLSVQLPVNLLSPAPGPLLRRLDALSRRDGGAPSASLPLGELFRRPCGTAFVANIFLLSHSTF